MARALSRLFEEPGKWALFLDIDGTLIDMAATPDAVVVPDGLASNLGRLSARLDGALALVTGRSLVFVDSLFEPYKFPTAGLHGAEIRGPDGNTLHVTPSPEFEALKQALAEEARDMPGVLIEDKGAAVAAHYRLAPQFETSLCERMRDYVHAAGPDWALQIGKFVFEIRPAGASKGGALERFLSDQPFVQRLPLAIGDDLTDEAMFAVANARGGYSIRIGDSTASTCAQGRAPSARDVRQAIADHV